jgi:hypothetical protein
MREFHHTIARFLDEDRMSAFQEVAAGRAEKREVSEFYHSETRAQNVSLPPLDT